MGLSRTVHARYRQQTDRQTDDRHYDDKGRAMHSKARQKLVTKTKTVGKSGGQEPSLGGSPPHGPVARGVLGVVTPPTSEGGGVPQTLPTRCTKLKNQKLLKVDF